jgi:hypothetical protein
MVSLKDSGYVTFYEIIKKPINVLAKPLDKEKELLLIKEHGKEILDKLYYISHKELMQMESITEVGKWRN